MQTVIQKAEASMDAAGETIQILTYYRSKRVDFQIKPATGETKLRIKRDVESLEQILCMLDGLSHSSDRKQMIKGISALLEILDDFLEGRERTLLLENSSERKSYLPVVRHSDYPLYNAYLSANDV